jgi:hypothetical protein
MDKWTPPWWKTSPSWLFPLLFGVGFMITQYLSWRDVWLKQGTPERPSVPKGIQLEWQTISHSSDDPAAAAKTSFTLVAEEDLRGKAVRISCDGPIYDKEFWTHAKSGDLVHQGDVRNEDTHSVIFDFSGERLATAQPFTAITGRVDSVMPLRVIRVEWVKLKAESSGRHRGH